MTLVQIKELLDKEVEARNTSLELCYERPDPLFIAQKYQDESIALICALFAYGNANQIIKFLESLDFDLLNQNEDTIRKLLSAHYYRFQKSEDVIALFIALKRLRDIESLENIFYIGYQKESNLLDGLWALIQAIRESYPQESYGYNFLVGKPAQKISSAGTYKRYLMYLRWMARKDSLDMGLWSKIDKKDLLMPLDTHTFNVSRKIGLLKRKSCDMKAAIELTERLRKFDQSDPIKYDFALYRLGQEKLV
ncbi:TIGR02757 family protein [Sulfurovum sp. zt1-1]|uniref:TIGR02757 family protein n=1 Tax=Sulfurovum zhangzhouensis TaxID=3019067 RepID=A0ABT7QVU6_9BACT|nr:TIGR02757 family protein [Sulfurovum zhangzhouensis]MDM5270955.1 TIGR02757 family protein [Sulfurovum zhangzhouensis]